MNNYDFTDVAYDVKSEIERITATYTDYTDYYLGRLRGAVSTNSYQTIESEMLRYNKKFYVIQKKHLEKIPTIINNCVLSIELEGIGTLYQIDNRPETCWIFASAMEIGDVYQSENLQVEIKNKIEKIDNSLVEDADIIDEIKNINKIKYKVMLKEKQDNYERAKGEVEYLKTKIKKAEEILAIREKTLEDAANNMNNNNIIHQLNSIKNNKYVEKVECKKITKALRVTTTDIYMTAPEREGDIRYLGKIQIDINLNNYTVRFKNLNNPRYNYWGNAGQHPHVSYEGNPCMGNLSEMLAEANQNNDLYIAVLQCIGFLQTYDPSDCAGAYYRSWDRVDEEGNIIEEGSWERHICEYCEDEYEDPDDLHPCPHCGRMVCANCEEYIERYDRYVCLSCADEYYVECEECGERVLEADAQQDSNGDWYCDHCAETCLAECANCGNVYNVENMKCMQDDDTGEVYFLCNGCR